MTFKIYGDKFTIILYDIISSKFHQTCWKVLSITCIWHRHRVVLSKMLVVFFFSQMLTLVALTLTLWGLRVMKTYWQSENTSLVLAAIVLWLRLYHLQNKCISEPKVGQMFTVFYFKETGINAKTECMTIKALQEMEISSLMKSTCNINLIVSNLTISKLSLIYLTIWKQSSIKHIYLFILRTMRFLTIFLEQWRLVW